MTIIISILFEIPGCDDPGSIASAVRLLMLMKNWLNKRKERKDVMDDDYKHNNLLRKEKNKSVIKLYSKTLSNAENNKSEKIVLIKRDFVSLLLYGHISKLNDFIPSLFGCEEWLRKEFKIVLKSEIVKEIFVAW